METGPYMGGIPSRIVFCKISGVSSSKFNISNYLVNPFGIAVRVPIAIDMTTDFFLHNLFTSICKCIFHFLSFFISLSISKAYYIKKGYLLFYNTNVWCIIVYVSISLNYEISWNVDLNCKTIFGGRE